MAAKADNRKARPGGGGILSRLLAPFTPRGQVKASDELAFPPDFLASLERLRLAALRALGGGLREGHRLGAYKGGQLEFHGHRNYVAGDELRYVDWNSYARLGRPYVKEFAREEAGVLNLLLDATPSMLLGSPSKWTFARRVAALFCHVANSSKDIARIYVFRQENSLQVFPARGAKSGGVECLRFLEGCKITGTTGTAPAAGDKDVLAKAVAAFLRGHPARGRMIIISDFWQEADEIVRAIARLSSAGHDVSAIHVLAAEELQPAIEGDILARSLEEDAEVELFGGAQLLEKYLREFETHRRAVEDVFRRRGGNYLMERSDTSIERVLIGILRQRRFVQ